MDKTEGDTCPRCGQKTLDVYYEEGSDLQLGARCEECGLKGFYVSGKLVPLATT
jgi:DNA-directed RNA polymerase subunit RPC12/RpoP